MTRGFVFFKSGVSKAALAPHRLCLLTAGLLAACAQAPIIPPPLKAPGGDDAAGQSTPAVPPETRIGALPTPILVESKAAQKAPAAAPAPAPKGKADEPIVLNFEQVSLGTFAQMVYVEVLKKNVNIDPQVLAKRDLVTFRSAAGQTNEQIDAAAKLLLKSYGVAALDLGGIVRIVPDNASYGNLPEIRRGAALPDTPQPLRPIFQLVDLKSVRQTDVTSYLRTLFGDRIKVQEDAIRNALLISGTPDNMEAALEAIKVLDQPALIGGRSLSISPVYSSADDFARRLVDVLTAQGYSVQPLTGPQGGGGIRYPIIVLPIAGLNAVYVFARGEDVIKHVEQLAASLDRANDRGIGRNFFTYSVKHKDATVLADTLEQLLSGSRTAAAAARPAGAAPAANAAATPARPSGVVVDKSTNTLIFQASADEYGQLLALMQRLDQPSKAALIEVTVAELSIDDTNQLGVEWQFANALSRGRVETVNTSGLGVAKNGFNYSLLGPASQVKIALNAMANDKKANILSSPRVLARNGETASIQVGEEVPIITSQQTGVGSGTQTQILQSIQYRNTGIILKVKPVIHSGDQIDLDVSQEVSSASTTETGVNASPTISSRKLDTKLTLSNGATVLLGGLISNEQTSSGVGVPYLKDIPVLGSLFRKKTVDGKRRELIVLITPYVISNGQDAEELTKAFRGMLRPWAQEIKPGAPVPSADNILR